jgi:hypothetical protein
MYGEGGSIREDYERVAATVTAVSIWINRNKNDKVISGMRNSQKARLGYLPGGIRSCTLVSRKPFIARCL